MYTICNYIIIYYYFITIKTHTNTEKGGGRPMPMSAPVSSFDTVLCVRARRRAAQFPIKRATKVVCEAVVCHSTCLFVCNSVCVCVVGYLLLAHTCVVLVTTVSEHMCV